MTDQKIEAHLITRPISLLAAWLTALVLLVSSFLAAAATISSPDWVPVLLAFAAIAIVPYFIRSIFVLLTKYRKEMLADPLYVEYENKQTKEIIRVDTPSILIEKMNDISKEIRKLKSTIGSQGVLESNESEGDLIKHGVATNYTISINDYIPDFYKLRKVLKADGYPTTDIFGRSNKSEPPTEWTISLDKDIDWDDIKKVLKLITQFDFDGIKVHSKSIGPYDQDDFYIGSYAEYEGFADFNETLKMIEKEDFEKVDFTHYVKVRMKETARDPS